MRLQTRPLIQRSKGNATNLETRWVKLLLVLGLVIFLGAPFASQSAAGLPLAEVEMYNDARGLAADLAPQEEIVASRTPFSATFQNADGLYTTVISAEPMHYQDEEGSWQAINPTFASSPEGFAVEHNSLQSQVGLRQPWLGVRVGETAAVWEATALGLVADEAFELLAEPLADGALPEKQEGGTILRYAGGWSDPTLTEAIISAPDSVEHALVLNSAPAGERTADYLELQATLDLLPGAAIWANGAKQATAFSTTERIEVRDALDQLAFVFNPVIAYEQENRSTAVVGEYLLEPGEADGQWLVRVRTPYSWWVDPQRQYPAVLDPTIEVLRTDGYGFGMAWVGSNPEDNLFKLGGIILGNYDFKKSDTRGYMQFNSMPAVLQTVSGNVQGPLQIDKVTLDFKPTAIGIPKWKHTKGDYPNWDKIVHKRSATLYYVEACPGSNENPPNCNISPTTFSMLDDRLLNPAWNWGNRPMDGDANVTEIGQGVIKAGPLKSNSDLEPTQWDVTTKVKEWYEKYYALGTRLGPTFMVKFDQTCDRYPPFEYGDSWRVKSCTWVDIPAGQAQLRIEYSKQTLQPDTNLVNVAGVPSYYPDVLNKETTNHQYDLETNSLSKWHGIAVRGNHLVENTLPTRVGLRLKEGDIALDTITNSTADQTIFMLMDGHNNYGDAALSGKPLTAEVISSNLNNFDQDQQRNYRLEYVSTSAEVFPTGVWQTLPYTLPSNRLLGLVEFPLQDGQTIGIFADGYPGLDIALVEPSVGSSSEDALIPVNSKRVNHLKSNGSGLSYLPAINVSNSGQWVLTVANQDPPELCPVGDDCDGDYAWREVEIRLLICNDGEIPTAKHDCQPVLTPDHPTFINSFVDLPTLGLKVYSPDFDVDEWIDENTQAPPSETNDWCTFGVKDGAPVIENTSLPDEKYVAVGQGDICYVAATKTLTTTADSGVGLMIPDPSIALSNRGRILPTFIYGNTTVFPVPAGMPDGRTQISFEDPTRLLPYEGTGRNIQPFEEYWRKDHDDYVHGIDFIDLAAMKAVGEGQIQAFVTIEAGTGPMPMIWDVHWDLRPDLAQNYLFDLIPLQDAPLSQPLDYASANLQIYSEDFTAAPDGLFNKMDSYLTASGPNAYQFYAPNARIINDVDLGGANKYIRAVIPPPGQPLQPAADFSCLFNNEATSCLDLRRSDYEWNGGDELNLKEWELPDVVINGQAATVAFASEGQLNIYSNDHPLATQGVDNINQSFAFETWGVTAKTSQGPCTPGGPNKTIIEGSGYVALPMIGSDGSGSGPHVELVNFTLCDNALRQAEMEFGVVPTPIPVGSTGFGVDVIGGSITVGPNSTTVVIDVGLLTQDRYTVTKGDKVKNGRVTINTDGLFSMEGSGLIVGKLDADYRLDISWEPLDVLTEGDISYGGGLITGFMRLHGWFGQGYQNKYSYLPDNNDFHFTGQIGATVQIKKGQLIDKKYLKVPWFNAGISAEVSFGEFCSNTSSCTPINWGMSATIKVFGYGVGVYVDKTGPEIFLGSSSKVLLDQCTGCGTLLNTNVPGPHERPLPADNAPDALLNFSTTEIPPGAVQPYLEQTFPDPFAGATQLDPQIYCAGYGTSTHNCLLYIASNQPAGRAMFNAGWINGHLDVTLVNPSGVPITADNAAQNHVTITPYVDLEGQREGITYVVNAATEGETIPWGNWRLILDGVAVSEPYNYYSLALATDPPPPQVTWTSVLSPQVTPQNGILPLTWDADRDGQALGFDGTSLDLFYAPVFQPPIWENIAVSFPGSYQDEAGLGTDWDPQGSVIAGDPNQDGIWRIAANIPPGEYSFLVARNGALDEYYGQNGLYQGQEISFTVPIDQGVPVIFMYDPRDNFAMTDVQHPVINLVGDMMEYASPTAAANPNWNPANLAGWMKPGSDSETFYETSLELPEGQYNYKIALNESWDENYGAGGIPDGPDIPFEVPEGGAIMRFTFDYATKEITHEVLASTPGVMITRLNDPSAGAYDWPTFSLTDGEYRVGLRIDDHFTGNGQIVSWAPGSVLIDDDNVPPPDPVILSTQVKKDAIDVYWQRNDDWLDLAGYLIEYDVPGTEPGTYFTRTKRMVPLPYSFSPFAQHARLGGLLMSDPNLNLPEIVTSICARSYDVHGNISGCSPVEVVMPIPEEVLYQTRIGPPQNLIVNDDDPLEVTWTPPISTTGTAAGYLLSYAPTGCLIADAYPPAAEGFSPLDVNDVLNYYLNGLVQDQSYVISVQAYTADGELSEPATMTGKVRNPTDNDSNGLPDIWAEIYGIEDPAGDQDADGLNNVREAAQGTDPFNSDSDFDGHYDAAELAWQTDLCGTEAPPYQAQGKLTLSGSDKLSFDVSENAPISEAQSLSVFNMGQGSLQWTATPSENWIRVSPANGGELSELSIWVDASGLQPGQQQKFVGEVVISAAHASVPLPNGNTMPAITESYRIGVEMTLLPAVSGVTQAFNLPSGWSLISSYIEPSDPALEAVFSGVSELVIIKNGAGQVYWPAYGINQIGSWDPLQAYQIFLSTGAAVYMNGPQSDAHQFIPLPAGWNMVAYLLSDPMPIGEALNTISGQLLLAKDEQGHVYWPELDINQIGEMQPGEGYQMYLVSPGSLSYLGP